MVTENVVVKFIANVKAFNAALATPLTHMRRIHTQSGKMNKELTKNMKMGHRLGFAFRRAMHGLRGFRMEMLGVMFFGMGLQKFFTGLLQPALKLTGIFELWSTVLAILFLPIALLLLDFLMPLFDWIINLSDSTKLFIGKLVLLGAALGAALFLFGMFALGIGSIILAFAGLFVILDKLIPDISVLGVNMSSFVEAGLAISLITGAVAILKSMIGTVFDAILSLDFVRGFLDRIGVTVDDSKKGWERFRDVVSQVWDKIKEKWGKVELTIGKEKLSFEVWLRVLQTRWHQFTTNLTKDKDKLVESVKSITDSFSTFFDTLDEKDAANALNIIAKAINLLAAAIERLKEAWERSIFGAGIAPTTPLGFLANPPKQIGGFIPHTGLYKLHAGETVNQAGDTINSSPIINVYGATSEDLVNQISEAVTRNLANLSRR